MRILWFSTSPTSFNPHDSTYNGGGWVASLEQIAKRNQDIELGVAFMFDAAEFRYENDGVYYYPIQTPKRSLKDKICRTSADMSETYLKIIADFKPDIIQIFGSENEFGTICSITDIPVVIHMQGSIPPYNNALFPPGMNTADFFTVPGLNRHYRFMGIRSEKSFRERAEHEVKTLQSCSYFMGRTEWDKNVVLLHNPNAQYFHCEEALRDSFLATTKQWEWRTDEKVRIISVISTPWYKGVDLILKTANLLKRFTDLDFEWNVYGVRDIRFFENKYGIKAADVNVNIKGVASKEELVDVLCAASCYVHSSYIDNSPNSLCEAQYLGVPVLATFVGGIPSMVKDGEDGILFPANDPYTLAGLIKRLHTDRELSKRLSCAARTRAHLRHDPTAIGKRLSEIYRSILELH